MNTESMGAAEKIIAALTSYTDHYYHGRCGIVQPDPGAVGGLKWEPASWKVEEGSTDKVVYRHDRVPNPKKPGKFTTNQVKIGVMAGDGTVVGTRYRFRGAGLFPEIVAVAYQNVADVWKLDNEFAARWASWSTTQEHRDLTCVLAAFMLVQNRSGQPVRDEAGKDVMRDDDFRAVGEALIFGKNFNPKMILRVGHILHLPEVVEINRALGFGTSRKAITGRYIDAVTKWLNHIETVPKLMTAIIDKGNFKSDVSELATLAGYKPLTPGFFKALRWRQEQSKDGRRVVAIGDAVKAAQTWAGKTEQEICEIIVKDKPGFKRVLGMLPPEIGLTQAIMAASIGVGLLSDTDLVIYSTTLEELGLLKNAQINERWSKAVAATENRRAANIALRMKDETSKQKLEDGADAALNKAVSKVVRERNFRIYLVVDISGSMQVALERAKGMAHFLVKAFPLDRLHIAVFNSYGRSIELKSNTAAGVEQGFRGITATGGTDHVTGVRVFEKNKPKPGEDALFVFVGDQQELMSTLFVNELRKYNPVALAMLDVNQGVKDASQYRHGSRIIADAANALGIPCLPIDEKAFADPYASVTLLSNLIDSTPVGAAARAAPAAAIKRKSLVETILETKLAQRPAWADVYKSMAKAA